ncbi:MAG: dTMP kinase [Bacteroidales bacterium]|jgi:dTMP kinase|nr:dTMP kinase [Bacteroidales bacterium]
MGLIVIEGLDGSGKSTQIKKLSEYLSAKGQKCRLLHFPRTDSPVYGELIARFLRGELGNIHQVNPYLVALMYAGDRFDFKPRLEEWLQQDVVVLLDRYVYSNVAYQCAKLQDDKEQQALREWILHLEFGYHALPTPDLNIFLDVPFEFTAANLSERRAGNDRGYLQGEGDIHESDLKFQADVRKMYLSLANEAGFAKIDCSQQGEILSVEQIFEKLLISVKEQVKIKHNIL